MNPAVEIVPANRASWEDLDAIFGQRDYPARCHCQRFKTGNPGYDGLTREVRAQRLREQSACGDPDSPGTSGLVAYVDREPAAWVAIEPRPQYPRLTQQVAWRGRSEDRADASVWAVTCFAVRKGYRGMGLTYPLAAAALAYARAQGASAVEGYPMVTEPGKEITWGELHVGPIGAFLAAGFEVVAAPTKRRRVVRVRLDAD